MKILIMGSGGMGAYCGGLLAQQGNEVTSRTASTVCCGNVI
jgi:ketopantoate reductase